MPDVPTRFAALLLVPRSWPQAQVLPVGAILAPGRRTVAGMLRATDPGATRTSPIIVGRHGAHEKADASCSDIRSGSFAPRGPATVGLDRRP